MFFPSFQGYISFLAAAIKERRFCLALNVKEESCNMCKALDDLIMMGVNQGEEYFAALSQKLLADFRTDDLQKAIQNKEYRKKLYRNTGLRDVRINRKAAKGTQILSALNVKGESCNM